LASEFEENGRSRVLYLHPLVTKARMTRECLKDAIEHNYDGDRGRSQYLPHCWMPRRMFVRWLAKHRLPESPPRFEPIACGLPESPPRSEPISSRRGRPPKLNWNAVKDKVWERMDWHGEFSDDDREWNCQARLEEAIAAFIVNELGAEAEESTIRGRVTQYLAEWRAGND
jgi:hypothetical protein